MTRRCICCGDPIPEKRRRSGKRRGVPRGMCDCDYQAVLRIVGMTDDQVLRLRERMALVEARFQIAMRIRELATTDTR